MGESKLGTSENEVIRAQSISNQKWKSELAKSAENYHLIGVYVAMVFDPLFGITDYFNIPDYWSDIFVLRCVVSIVTLLGLWLYKKGLISVYLLVAIPYTLISLQNAYTFSVISNDHILGHNLNYIALFLGAGLFLVWPIFYSLLAIGLSILVTGFFVSANSSIDLDHFAVEGGLLLLTSALFTIFMIQGRYRLKKRELQALLALKENLKITSLQKSEIESKNSELAERAQQLAAVKSEIEKINTRLQSSNEELEKAVEERTDKLAKTNKEMDQLVYSLSHDFRTPMVNARGLLTLLKMQDLDAESAVIVKKIDACVLRFDELLHDLMNYAVYWDLNTQIKNVKYSDIVQNVWADLSHQHKNESEIIIQDSVASMQIDTSPEKIRVLTYCILSNAVRYKKTDQPSKVVVDYKAEGNYHSIILKDNGIGIKSATMPKVFDMYYRGHEASLGAGLGLYIAKGIARQIGMEIEIHSEINEGTEVQIKWVTSA